MNLRHWRHFLQIAAIGSLSRAAEKLGVAQPVLSREMHELESVIGAALFTRHARGVMLTAGGETFRRRAEAILSEIARIPSDVGAASQSLSGRLALGAPPSLAYLVTAPAIAQYRSDFPAVRLHLREATSIAVRESLLDREIDLGVLCLPVIEPGLSLEPFVNERMVLLGPPGSHLSRTKPISITAIARYPLILSARPNSTRILVDHALEAAGLSAHVPIETDTAPITELVGRGLGYSVVPSSLVMSFVSKTGPASSLPWAPIKNLRISWMIASIANARPSRLDSEMRLRLTAAAACAIADGSWPAALLANSTRLDVLARRASQGRRNRS
jgi:LysR family nitrogen assimilation transcriptional regulator